MWPKRMALKYEIDKCGGINMQRLNAIRNSFSGRKHNTSEMIVMKKRIRSREIIPRSLRVWELTQKELRNRMK